MKKYFAVSYKYSESVFCSNIAHAESVEAVEAHYSKYEWFNVRECETYEVETARHKGMPIVEIEAEKKEEKAETMRAFEHIAAEVEQDAERSKARTAEAIESNETALERNSTATRWAQYKSGKISREAANAYAIARNNKQVDKHTAERLAHLERVAEAPELDYISICVEWKRSATWGQNPTAYANTGNERGTGTASGCGYDKGSSAVAEALNQCDSVLKALYSYKEKQLSEGKTDESRTACTGRDNRNIIAYGAGYSAIPYFEGGVGVSCFWSIFSLLGFTVRSDRSGKHTDFYTITKKGA